MNSKLVWRLRRLSRALWFRATLIAMLAVASALIAFFIAPYLPTELSTKIGAEAVDNILTIIASSMLAVTTFSLSTMVAAYSSATSNVTPRATTLMIEDTTTQNVLATFMGSFLFSLVAIITLSMGAYGERGRIVLFVVTILVVLLIVVTLVRWIDYLRRLGRVGETTQQVETAASRAMEARRRQPFLGGVALMGAPAAGRAVYPEEVGYVQHVAMEVIEECAVDSEIVIDVLALPGTFVHPARALAIVPGGDEELAKRVAAAFTVDKERSFDQDPRFGVIVLAEIASRALSPGVNDPGTAIDVLGRAVRILASWAREEPPEDPAYTHVRVPEIKLAELFDDLFAPIGRDGASQVEVQMRLQKALAALAEIGGPRFRVQAEKHSAIALERAELAMPLAADIERVREAAGFVRRVIASEARP